MFFSQTDPGVPIVYAGFGALMLTTCISYLSHSQVNFLWLYMLLDLQLNACRSWFVMMLVCHDVIFCYT